MIDIEKVQELIEEDINPALKQHDGFCILDLVEDEPPKIYLSFYGGCQACPHAFGKTLAQVQHHLRMELEIEDLEVLNTEET